MQKAPLSRPALAGARILIVDDEFLVAMDLEDRLKREGCDVIGPVPRETKALALLEQGRPDAVVLDLNLDGKLPLDLANTLVARQILFVIVTGYGNRHLGVPALQDTAGVLRTSPQRQPMTRSCHGRHAIMRMSTGQAHSLAKVNGAAARPSHCCKIACVVNRDPAKEACHGPR